MMAWLAVVALSVGSRFEYMTGGVVVVLGEPRFGAGERRPGGICRRDALMTL